MKRILIMTLALMFCLVRPAVAGDWQDVNDDALALLHTNEPDFDKAEDTAKRALKMAQKADDKADIATSFNTLGRVYEAHKQFDPALAMYFEALKLRVALYGPESVEAARNLNNIGNVYSSLTQIDTAAVCYEKSIKILEEANAPSTDVARVAVNLAEVSVDKKRYKLAEQLIDHATEILETTLGKFDSSVGHALKIRAYLYKQTGRVEEAKEIEARAKSIRAIPRDVPSSVSI